MSMRGVFAGAFAGVLCFVLLPGGRAQLLTVEKMGPDAYVQVRMDTTGEATLSAWSRNGGGELAQHLPEVLHCHDGLKTDTNRGTRFAALMRCAATAWRSKPSWTSHRSRESSMDPPGLNSL